MVDGVRLKKVLFIALKNPYKMFDFNLLNYSFYFQFYRCCYFIRKLSYNMNTRKKGSTSKILENHHGENTFLSQVKLPTYGEVLNCYLAKVNELKGKHMSSICNKVKYEAASSVAEKVIEI